MFLKVEKCVHCMKDWLYHSVKYLNLKCIVVDTMNIHYIKISVIYDTLTFTYKW